MFDLTARQKGPEDIQQIQGEIDKDTSHAKEDDGARSYFRARDDYREARDKIIEMHNLVLKVSWPESSRLEEWRIIGHAQALGKDDKFIRGHIPEAKYARGLDRYSTRHIRRFLGLEPDGCSGTRALRLIVMGRLRPIHDLDGERFWKTFWQCVACHYRLWLNGVRHCDISYKNLMYGISETSDPVGIVNDFDLATWTNHSTPRNDCTGTIPFMAIDLLDNELGDCIPRLYRHDMESFVWVLAYITVANIEYRDRTIEISPLLQVNAWFTDDDKWKRCGHIGSKLRFHLDYGRKQRVFQDYFRYHSVIKQMIRYWVDLYNSLQAIKYPPQPLDPDTLEPVQDEEELVPCKPEVDDPTECLRQFITTVERSFGESGTGEGFAEVKTLLLKAIQLPTTKVEVSM